MSGFVFSGASSSSSDVQMQFADGLHVIPKWMVAHLGGTEAVQSPESAAKFKTVTFEQMVRAFHKRVSGSVLKGVQDRIVAEHMRAIRRY